MKFKLLFFLLFALFVAPIHANDLPINYPADVNYIVADGKIYTQGGEKARLGFFADRIEDAVRMAEYYEDSIRSSALVQESNYAEFFSDAEIVHVYYNDSLYNICVYISKPMDGYLIDPDFCMQCESAFIDAGFSTYSFYQEDFGVYYADAEYSEEPEPDPQEPTPPEGLVDGCITYYQGAWRYTSELEGPTGDILLQGQTMYAETEEMADRCAADFAFFLASYDWPYYGKPDVLPWSEPLVQKCYVIRNGEVSSVFWRIFFYDLSDPVCPYYSAWNQCLYDYNLSGSGCGGENGIIIYGPSSTASASNTGSVQLNGNQLAQADSGTSTVKLTSGSKDVAVTQYTVQKVDAEGDTVGTSEVTSEASVSEGSDGSINVTNNTTINTNLELGDAPAADSFITEERQVSSSSDLLTETEPEYTYIVKGGSADYSIDYEKLWEDVKLKFSEIFGFDVLTEFFKGVQLTDYTTYPVRVPLVWQDWDFSFSFDILAITQYSFLSVMRVVMAFFACYETLFACIKLFA